MKYAFEGATPSGVKAPTDSKKHTHEEVLTDAHLDTTMRAICRLFTLMDADQQEKHHDHVHAPLVLGTEQKQ